MSGIHYKNGGYIISSKPSLTFIRGTTTATPTLSIQNTGTNFYDVSPNNFTVTKVGTIAVDSDTSYVSSGGTGSMACNGGYLTLPSNAAWQVGFGDFTAHGWLYPRAGAYAAGSVYNGLFDFHAAGNTAGGRSDGLFCGWFGNEKNLYMFGSGSFLVNATSYTLTPNAWQHVAFMRKSGIGYIFLNGQMVKSGDMSAQNISDTNLSLNCVTDSTGGQPSKHKSAGLQFFKGIALYPTTGFTVPTTETPLGPTIVDSYNTSTYGVYKL